MTLHWWMHWFWITCLTIPVCVCNPTPTTLPPASTEGGQVSLAAPVSTAESNLPEETVIPLDTRQPPVSNSRSAKAIGHFPKSTVPVLPSPQPPDLRAVSIAFPQPSRDDGTPSLQSELSIRLRIATTTTPAAVTAQDNEDVHDTEVPPIDVTSSQPNITVPTNNTTKNDTATEATDNSTKKSNNTSSSLAEPEESSKNDSSIIPLTIPLTPPTINETEPEESEVSTVKALSLETAVERRAAGGNVVSGVAAQGNNNGGGSHMDAASVAGICFGCLVIVALSGAISFVLYRRRYLNKPQTLNDKCSNPDSSGYIDDSTIRENSEEMYSLDNDSFLNSLEAMTIQNYWTDSVKHTKL